MKSLRTLRRSAIFQHDLSHGFQPADGTNYPAPLRGAIATDWKSALRQVGTLCYALSFILLTGCLFKPATVTPRHFVLSPIPADPINPPSTAPAGRLSVGIAHVKMPPYLLRDSIAFRNGANEIGYLEDATWGEHLDECLQRVLAANLSQLLSSDSIYAVDSGHNQALRVLVNVQQFDVDTHGRGVLIAQWRITGQEQEKPLKSGRAEFFRVGPTPHGHPEAIATTLSGLAADFSRDLAQAIRSAPMYGDAHE